MSVRLGPVCLFLLGVLMAQQELFASDCICVKYPMYPYSGNNWMHYAIKTKDACANDYPTPQIQPYTATPQECISDTDCGQCTTLGDPASVLTVISSHLFTFSDGRPPRYLDVNSVDGIRAYLLANINRTNVITNQPDLFTDQEYADARNHLMNDVTFESPDGPNQPPSVVKLTRNVAVGVSEFHVVLWKMQTNNNKTWGYFGVEIDNTGLPATILTPTSICWAQVLAKDGFLFQRILVKGALEVEVGDNMYVVRLFNSAGNHRRDAFPNCLPHEIRKLSSPMKTGGSTACQSCNGTQQATTCQNSGTQLVYRNRCRNTCRVTRRQCR